MAADLREVVDQLYGADVAEFTESRNRCAAQARKDGDKELAAAIAALGKPSRSAYAVNLLVRRDPAVGDDLTELGAELRDAEQARDAGRMRDLARRRRRVIDGLADQAFDLIGVDEPAAALRDEVTATLTAALADPDVAEQIRAGALVRPVRWEGFGSVPLSRISALPVRAPRTDPQRPAVKDARPAATSSGAASSGESAKAGRAAEAARRREQQKKRADDIAAARKAARGAEAELTKVAGRVEKLEQTIRDLEGELADAHRDLDGARRDLRHARTQHREAVRALEKRENQE
jgi:hypothetical protein